MYVYVSACSVYTYVCVNMVTWRLVYVQHERVYTCINLLRNVYFGAPTLYVSAVKL